MASGRPLLKGESHQLQGRSQEYQTPLACEGGMGRSTGGVIRAGMVAHSPIHTLPTLSHSIIRYQIILPTPLHSAHCVTAPPTPLLPRPPHAGHDDAIDPSQFDVDLQTEVGQGLEVDLCHIANLHTLLCHTYLCVTHTLHYRCVCVGVRGQKDTGSVL